MAQEIADSKLIDTWGSSGTKIEPDISKIIEGWQLGEQPPHEYMNWLQNTFGSKLNHILKNGVAEWNNETEYLAGASVQHSGNVWICETTNTNSEPTELNTNWEKVAINKDLTLAVNTLADLRSVSYPADTVWASGYHAKNDGAFGSHIFRLKGVKTTETDNGGTVIIATIGGTDYVYELQYDGAVNVKWFGAKGDGVTDDMNAIRNCATNHSLIEFDMLTYYISDRVVFRKEQIVLGRGAILKINGDYAGVQLFGNTLVDNLIVSQYSGNLEGVGYVVNAGIDEITGLDNGNIQAFQTKNIEVIGCEIAFKQIATHPSQVRGITYSKTHARRFYNCKYSYYFETQGKGWINANEYENKQILAETTIPGSAGIKIEHHGLELSSHSFKGMLFEKVAELIEHSSTGATFQFVGFEIEGYFESVGLNNLNTSNEIFIKNTRNRHSIQDVYAGSRYSTTIVKGNSDKQGGNFRIERVSTTDEGNVIGWEFKDDNYPNRFKIADKNRFYYNGSFQDKWVGRVSKTGGTVIITIANYQAETIVCKVRIMTRCTYNTTRRFYEGLLTVDQTGGVVFLDSMNNLNSLTVVSSVSGLDLLLTITAPTNDFYLYSMNIEGSINKNITVA